MLLLLLAVQKLTEENGRLKVQVEEYKAEISLQSMLVRAAWRADIG